MPEIKINIDSKTFTKLIKKLNKKLDLSPVMRDISQFMLDSVEENFEQEGRPKWKPLKSSTIKQRKREGYWPGKILQRSGQLASSIQTAYSRNTASVFTNKLYAAIHQLGGKAGRKHSANIPARPYMKLQDSEIKDIVQMISDYFKDL